MALFYLGLDAVLRNAMVSNDAVPKTTASKRWNCQVIRPANCCHLLPSNRFLYGFPDQSQFAAAKLTHYSTMQHRPSDSSRPRQRILLSGDVHQNPGSVTNIHVPLQLPITTKASDGDPFTILQFNANGIGNKQVELGEFLERHKF